MYHGIQFGDKDTFEDWHLAPTSRPVFNPPKAKQKFLDIPGASGTLDLTESLTSFPIYEDREGDIEFYVLNDYEDWSTIYSNIMNYLHGRKMKAILEDDPSFYYEGRFTVKQWKSESYWSKVTISYKVNPYKWRNETASDENWLWDPFNFDTDYIMTMLFSSIEMNGNWITNTYIESMYGVAPVMPKFIVTGSAVELRFVNPTLGVDETQTLQVGDNEIYDFMFAGPSCTVSLKGNVGSTVTIDFRQGRL